MNPPLRSAGRLDAQRLLQELLLVIHVAEVAVGVAKAHLRGGAPPPGLRSKRSCMGDRRRASWETESWVKILWRWTGLYEGSVLDLDCRAHSA